MTPGDNSNERRDEDKSTIGERITGVRDPKDPDGLLTVAQARDLPDPGAIGTDEKEPPDPTETS